jgi:hypothetical protein
MANPCETAVDTYIRAASERDPALREKMLEACFAADGRIVARNGVTRGRAAVAAAFTRFLSDPRLRGIRMVSAIDALGNSFRFRALADYEDGTSIEIFDAGEIDTTGRISTVLTFNGPLAEAGD